ncbi:hypothetical protein ACQ4PT_068438 [Festuca glaucescens]
MTASVVYQLLALDLDPWFLEAVDKLRRDFFWAGDRDSSVGRCMVAWNLVCRPKRLGGLGFHNLAMLNSALRAKWIWLRKTDSNRSWAGLDLKAMPAATQLFNASVIVNIGDGASTLFWLDPWIDGLTAAAIAPAVLALVKPRFQKIRSVQQALVDNAWALDIRGALSVDAVVQYLRLWSAVDRTPTGAGDDTFRWKWIAHGGFSSRSAYYIQHEGTGAMAGATNVWNLFAPMAFKIHAWLALRHRCWSTDRLARHGLPSHVTCPLCGVADETIDHISLLCPYAGSIWAGVDATLDYHLPALALGLSEWWPDAVAPYGARGARKPTP